MVEEDDLFLWSGGDLAVDLFSRLSFDGLFHFILKVVFWQYWVRYELHLGDSLSLEGCV